MDKFEAQRAKFERNGISTEMVWSFHGTTSREAVESIVKNNFDMARLASTSENEKHFLGGCKSRMK